MYKKTEGVLLHFASDEKFIDKAIKKFEEVAPGRNRYLIIGNNNPLKFVKSELAEQMSERDAVRVTRSSSHSSVIFHGLTNARIRLLRHIRPEVSTAWVGWGFDYYPTLLRRAYPSGLFAPMTLPLAQALGKVPTGRLERLRTYIRYLRNHRSALTKRKLKKIDFFIPVLRSEWELCRTVNRWFNAKYLPWSYAVGESTTRPAINGRAERRNILIGNSASLTNNHVDVFAALAKAPHAYPYHQAIVPLNYGAHDTVKAKIKEAGRYYLGKRFVPIDDFLPIEEYCRILASCHTMFMNHIRQQGTGNISLAAQFGVRIVLNSASPVCEELNLRGVTYQTMENFTMGPLDEEAMQANRSAELADISRRSDPMRTLALIDALDRARGVPR